MFHNCLCHRGTWAEQFTTLTSHSNLQRMLLAQRLHRSLRSQFIRPILQQSVRWSSRLQCVSSELPPSKKRQCLKYWCCDLFCSLTLFSIFLRASAEVIRRFPPRICATAGLGLSGQRGWGAAAWRCLMKQRHTVLQPPSVLLQPLRDQSQTPAEQSSSNYNASRAALILAQLWVGSKRSEAAQIRLCGSRREGKEAERRCSIEEEEETKSERYKWDDRGWGAAGAESRTEWRKRRAKLAPFFCQHISSHCLFFFCPPLHSTTTSIFNRLCQSQSTAQMRLWATSLGEI